jgi:hypothetical protein
VETFLSVLLNEQYYFIILIRYLKGLLVNFLGEVDSATLRLVLQGR